MQKRKILFFDIDNTIWNRRNEFPESTRQAILEVRRNGHLVFLNSGRGRGYIRDPGLLSLGFDGIVSGCGTMIEYRDETLFLYEMDRELTEHTILTVRKYGCKPILEGKAYLYMDDSEFGQDEYGKKLKRELGERWLQISDHWGKWEASKLSCATETPERDKCFEVLSPYFEFMIHNKNVAEMVPKGFDKGTGIAKVCEYLDADIADTIAFGDSANDLGMFRAAGLAVAMGNGTDEAKAAADFVTAPLEENGIWKACRQMQLI